MSKDPIVEEVREIRRRTEEACGNDWDKLFAHFQEVRKRLARPTVSRQPKPLIQTRSERKTGPNGVRHFFMAPSKSFRPLEIRKENWTRRRGGAEDEKRKYR